MIKETKAERNIKPKISKWKQKKQVKRATGYLRGSKERKYEI